MAGISSKAAGSLENRKKFNDGTELNNDFDISLYETEFRSLDPQIGRFWQTDPLAEARDNQSPFAFADNNPTTLNDPLGLSTDSLPKRQKVVTVPGKTDARITPVIPFTPPPAPVTPPAVAPTPSPSPTPAPNPGPAPLFAPLILPAVLTAIFTAIPISTGQELSPDESAKRLWELTRFDPWPGHGNNKNNTNPHIVYSFTFTPVSGTPVLKYGISDEFRYGLERPEGQLFNLQLKYGFTVKMHILTRTINREQALLYERQLVTQHVNQWGIMPLAQLRPGPF